MDPKDEFKFPDEVEDTKNEIKVEIETDDTDDLEIEVVDDTPEKDRGRKPLEREVEDPTEDEIEQYTKGAQERIKELTHARHDERRAKEATMREKQELERLAQQLIEENKRLKKQIFPRQSWPVARQVSPTKKHLPPWLFVPPLCCPQLWLAWVVGFAR